MATISIIKTLLNKNESGNKRVGRPKKYDFTKLNDFDPIINKCNSGRKQIVDDKKEYRDEKRNYHKCIYRMNENIREYRKTKNKEYSLRHKDKFHCELCDFSSPTIYRINKHCLTNKHKKAIGNLENKFVIKNTYTNEFIM